MQTERVTTNETCNEACGSWHLHRPAERPAFVAVEAVRARIEAARAAGAREIVLEGGEPALRRDLPALVRDVAATGARVVLETNATLITARRARALAAAGLDLARVRLLAWGDVGDGLTGYRGGFAAARAGLDAFAAAGVPLEIVTPVVRRNLALLPALPSRAAASGLPLKALLLTLPPALGPEMAPIAAHVAAIAAVAETGRRVGLTVRLDPGTLLPPCLFPNPEKVAHLFALTRGGADRAGYGHVGACESCLAHDRCPGVPLAALAAEPGLETTIRPITDDRLRRRLTQVSLIEEQIGRELVARNVTRGDDGRLVASRTIRVNFHCNQACHFCFVSTHLPPAREAAVRAAVVEAARMGAVIELSGGEPTLNPRLPDYVRLAKREGALRVELQTNAIPLGASGRARELAEAGLDEALVSLHASVPEISDAITGAPGTWVKTVAGIDELARTSIGVRLNFVICQANLRDFPALVSLVSTRWRQASVVVSFVASHTDLVPRTAALIPRYSEAVPFLAEGLRLARSRGVRVSGFDSQCGIPLCQVPEEERAGFFRLAELPAEAGDEFVKTEACASCALSTRCFGLRRGYAELYGADELRPV